MNPFRNWREEETGERCTGDRDVAEVGVVADAVCEDATRREGVVDPEKAADGANAHGADSEVEEGTDEVAYYEEGERKTRDGDWDEIECVDADDAKVVDDVNGAASAEDERAVAEASNNKAEKSEKPRAGELGLSGRMQISPDFSGERLEYFGLFCLESSFEFL
ncbi:hypothetical protein HPB52_000192 [Rhipicephalus sanguineus]|uniref:Uncharacterized protein n=1 Tax=Rhipicephalus sanguineus TaxID=34632 RepID=A0A9D4PT65_RHISA|nr:hypothetical protein HPB52_000192 [Rhipicephalus sanguineus]